MIRRLAHEDATAAAQLLLDFNAEFDEPAPALHVLRTRIVELIDGGDTIILITGDGPDGIAVLRLRLSIWTPRLECYLAELYIRPELRGHGLGRGLLLAALDAAREAGADYMDLGTAETDVAARRLYESVGFSNREGRPDGPVNLYYERAL